MGAVRWGGVDGLVGELCFAFRGCVWGGGGGENAHVCGLKSKAAAAANPAAAFSTSSRPDGSPGP